MDDFDIYGDLHVIEQEANQERQEVQELERKIADLQAQLLTKEQEKQAIVEKNVILSENISSLLLTAKAELKRKDTIIADLRKQCDDTVFRRKHLHYKEVHRASKCTQTYYVRQIHIGVQVENPEDESVGRTKKSDVGKIHDRDRDRDRQKDRDRERSSYRERDRVRERDRTRDRDKSHTLDRDHDRFRERDRHKDWHRDREKVLHPRQWERDQTGDRHRTRDSSGHRTNIDGHRADNERTNDDRTREGSRDSDRKSARERQKEYQHDLETRCEPRGVRATAKSTDQNKDKPLRNDQKSIRQEDSLHSTDRKTKMQNHENSMFEVADRKAHSHTLVSKSNTNRPCDAINKKNEEIPLVSVISKVPEVKALTDQPLCSGVECSETNEKEKETDRTPLLVNKPVRKTIEIHSETDPSVSSISIEDCGIAEKNAVMLGQKKSETYFEASVLDNPIPYSIPAAIESVSDNEKNLQCHRNQQNHVSVTQQTEMSYFRNIDCTSRVDCGKLIDSPQGFDKTDQSSYVSNLNQNKKSCAHQSVEDATIFANMLDVCGESHTIGDPGIHQEANIDVKAINNQLASSSFLENVLEGVDDVRNKSNENNNFLSENNEVVDDATHQAEGIPPKEHKDSCRTTEVIFNVSSDDTHITKDTSIDDGKADGNLESIGHGAGNSKTRRNEKSIISSCDDSIATNIAGDSAGKTAAKITVDVHYSQDKSYNVEDISVWRDHLMSLDEGTKEQEPSNGELDRVVNAVDYASSNNGLNLVEDGGGLKKQLKPCAHDVHSNSDIKPNEHQTPSAENGVVLLSEMSGATGETPASVTKSSPENTHDSLGVSDAEPTHREARTSAPEMRLEENPVECRIDEHVDETNDSGSNPVLVLNQERMRPRSKSVCLEMVTVCRQDDDESCDNVVYSPSKTEQALLISKTEENARNCKTSEAVCDHGAPSEQDSSSSSVNLKQRDKFVPLSNPDGSGSIRGRLRKMFCTERYHKSSSFPGTSKRRLSLDSAPIAPKKQKAENDCIDNNSKSSSSATSKLSDTFFSSIFLPIVSSLDSIHTKAESPTPIRACPMLHTSNMGSMVVVHSPIKFECAPPKGQDTTQKLMDSLLVPWVKDEDDGEGHGCIANDHSRKDNEVDNIRFSPQHLLASSTPLIVKPQSRLHHSTSSVPAIPSDGGACTAVKVTVNSKSWTAPLEHPVPPCGSLSVTADAANCKEKYNPKPNEPKSTEVVVDVSQSKRPTSTSKTVHRQSGAEGRICMSNDTDDRIVVSDIGSKHSDKDRLTFSPDSIDKGSKKRHDLASNIDEKAVVSGNAENHASKKNLPPGMFKTPDAVKSRNRLHHTPTNTLPSVSFSSREPNEYRTNQKQNRSPVAAKVRDNSTPLTSRKRSRTSTSPKRRKIDVTEGEGISPGKSQDELSPATNKKRKRRNIAVEEISKESMPTNISIRPRDVENKANAEGERVLVRKNKAMSGVRNLSTKGEAAEYTSVDKTITTASPLEGSGTVSRSSNVSPSSLCNIISTPHSLQQQAEERTEATVKMPAVVASESESLSGQGRDTTTSLMSPTSGTATKKMCNFSLNLSLASTTTVETDTSITQKSEAPVRFVREMRIVKENPKLLRVYINRRGD